MKKYLLRSLAVVGGGLIGCYVLLVAGVSCMEEQWEQPFVSFTNTNITNPDLNSLQNCEWMGKELRVVDDRKEAAFGYLFKGNYFRVQFDPSEVLDHETSAKCVSIDSNNKFYSVFPTAGPQQTAQPANAKFLRTVKTEMPVKPRSQRPFPTTRGK